MSQKSKEEGVRTSLVLSEHASTLRGMVWVCVSKQRRQKKLWRGKSHPGRKKRKEEEEKRAKEKGKSLNPVLA